jgi:hypothetical protein
LRRPSRCTALFQKDREGSVRGPFVDHVGGAVAEQQVAIAAFLDPDRAFGEAEMLAQSFQLGIGRDDVVQGRI